MNTIKIALVITIILFLSLTSCNKYEDSPMISFVSRNERIATNWKIEKVLDEGSEVTSSFNRYDITLTQGGNSNLTDHYSILTHN